MWLNSTRKRMCHWRGIMQINIHKIFQFTTSQKLENMILRIRPVSNCSVTNQFAKILTSKLIFLLHVTSCYKLTARVMHVRFSKPEWHLLRLVMVRCVGSGWVTFLFTVEAFDGTVEYWKGWWADKWPNKFDVEDCVVRIIIDAWTCSSVAPNCFHSSHRNTGVILLWGFYNPGKVTIRISTVITGFLKMNS